MTLMTDTCAGQDVTRLVAASNLPYGVGQSLARTIFFLGPFTFGAIVLETAASLPSNLGVLYAGINARSRQEDFPRALVRIAAMFSQATALAAIGIYVVYTHGEARIHCSAWPHALVAMSALAIAFAVVVFVGQAMLMPRNLPRPLVCALGFLLTAQVIATLVTIPSWRGGLRPSGTACYLRISRWYGVASLLPLLAMLAAITTLTIGVTQDHCRRSGFSKASIKRDSEEAIATTSGARLRDSNAEKHLSHTERLYKSAHLRVPGRTKPEQVHAFQESFLKLSSDGGSIRTAAMEGRQSFRILVKYSAWAVFTSLTLLCGAIIAFMDISPVLTL